jgi:predicted membrane protein
MNNTTISKELLQANNKTFFKKVRLKILLTMPISIAMFGFGYKIGHLEVFGFFISLVGLIVFILGMVLLIHAYLVSKRDY